MRTALTLFFALLCSIAVAHTDGIYNRTANSVGDTQGIDSTAVAGGGGCALDTSTCSWIAQVTTNGGTVGATRQGVVNTFVTCLKSASLFTLLDRYWLFAGENAGSALTDIKGLTLATNTNSMTFTASVGYQGSGTQFINTNFTPSTQGVNYLQNSAVAGVQIQNNRTTDANAFAFGSDDAGAFTKVLDFLPLNAGAYGSVVNNANSAGGASTTARRSWLINRTASTAGATFVNGVSDGLFNANVTVGVPTTPVYVGGVNIAGLFGGSSDQFSAFYIGGNSGGGGWTGTQVTNFETCQNAMMTSIGIAVH